MFQILANEQEKKQPTNASDGVKKFLWIREHFCCCFRPIDSWLILLHKMHFILARRIKSVPFQLLVQFQRMHTKQSQNIDFVVMLSFSRSSSQMDICHTNITIDQKRKEERRGKKDYRQSPNTCAQTRFIKTDNRYTFGLVMCVGFFFFVPIRCKIPPEKKSKWIFEPFFEFNISRSSQRESEIMSMTLASIIDEDDVGRWCAAAAVNVLLPVGTRHTSTTEMNERERITTAQCVHCSIK